MKAIITPRPLYGTLPAVSSKSHAHRLLLAASLSSVPSKVHINHIPEDIKATVRCLDALGAGCRILEDGVFIQPIHSRTKKATLDCGESGSTARFLLPLAAILCDEATLTGSGRLPKRPFAPLTKALSENGCEISGDFLPITVKNGLSGGTFSIEGNISSQFITGLFFALPLLKEDSTINLLSPLQSVGYVDLTLSVLRQFGVQIEKDENRYYIPGGQRYISPGDTISEGDWSSAAFFLACENLGGNVSVTGLNKNSLQRDMYVLTLLDTLKNTKGTCTIDCSDIPDLVPILAVCAAARQGETIFSGAARLRLKETDRLYTTMRLLRDLGGTAEETPDSLHVIGNGMLSGGKVQSFGDHRIAMAAAMASQICSKTVELDGAEDVKKSYPTFWDDFKRMGGQYNVI